MTRRIESSSSPAVSVIMATYNGSRNLRPSINSILSQTWRDLELIVVDDCSTDDTAAILATYDDSRLKITRNERNLNVVASRNCCVAQARGEFIAMLDHDDLSAPTRLARQVAYLRANPDTVLLGTAANILQDGQISEMKHPRTTSPGLIRWLLHVANPLICSSVMFRAAAARQLSVFMRETHRYADDYDFYHRMATVGKIARLDEPLTLYRLHQGNTYKQQEETMAAGAEKVLESVYRPLFGDQALEAAALVVRHLSRGQAVADEKTLRQLCVVFDTLNQSFYDSPAADATTRCGVLQHSALLWRRMLRATAREGNIGIGNLLACHPAGIHPNPVDRLRVLADRLPLRGRVRDIVHSARAVHALRVCPVVRLFGSRSQWE
jgi:glycosyltransferase involved in cell wall biosynthesis